MRTRVISGAVMTVILVAAIILGGPVIGVLMWGISLIGYFEMERALGLHTSAKSLNILELLSYITITVYYAVMILLSGKEYIWYQMILLVFLLLNMALYVFTFPKYDWKQMVANLFSLIYAPVMLSFIYLIREDFEHGAYIVVMVFIASWISDTGAYFVGSACGKHKLAPVLSPKKSVEGSIGGIVCAAGIGALYALLLERLGLCPAEYIWVFAIIGGLGSIISQLGDLGASAIKRQTGIKDYGKLIPGHGGIMDRFDSVIVTAPLIYYLAYFFIK
jgi:phosphatidate cytidylyltransferase